MTNSQVKQDEFVDLYDALNLSQDADEKQIRQSINASYLESQQNLDHRNPKKRLRYQQLYEVILPQARHLLLDESRRAEYDRYLTAFKTGTKVQSSTEDASSHKFETKERVTVTERLKEEEGVDPEKLAEQREDMWAQWKQGLVEVEEESPAPVKSPLQAKPVQKPSRPTEPQQTRAPELRRATLPGEAQGEVHRGFNDAALHAGGVGRTAEDKRQDDLHRAKIIDKAAHNAMFTRAIMMGVPVFIGCVVVFYFLTTYLTTNGILIGLPGQIMNLGYIPAALVIAFVQGRNAGETARHQTIEKMSRHTLDDLKRQGKG